MFLDSFVLKANKIISEYPEVISYLNSRAIEEDEIKKFRIGFVKASKIEKEDTLEYERFKEETKNFKKLYNRIIFPLCNLLGQTTGLCLRKIDVKEYTLYYLIEAKKIGVFFGLVQALPYIRQYKRVFVHEGAINVISFAKIFPESIASLTSFLSDPQYELLNFLCEKIFLVYDNDEAGHLGVKKVINRYGKTKIEPLFLENGDANDYLVFFGKEKFRSWLRTKYPYLFINEMESN